MCWGMLCGKDAVEHIAPQSVAHAGVGGAATPVELDTSDITKVYEYVTRIPSDEWPRFLIDRALQANKDYVASYNQREPRALGQLNSVWSLQNAWHLIVQALRYEQKVDVAFIEAIHATVMSFCHESFLTIISQGTRISYKPKPGTTFIKQARATTSGFKAGEVLFLLSKITSAQFAEYQAYWSLEICGDYAGDRRFNMPYLGAQLILIDAIL